LKVQFTDSSTGTITSRLWDFGDNTTDTSKNPLHGYITTGSFSVKLVVSGPGGKDSITKANYIVITASIPKPVPKISGTPTSGTDSLKVQFIDSSTGTITSRLWTFGDNATDTSKNPLHGYITTGSFSVKLVVSGPGGKDSVTKANYIVITASVAKPKAGFSGAPTSGTDSLKVQFTDLSTGTITSRLWDFGDGSIDSSKNPLHDYTKTGSFSVKLVVVGPGGKDSTTGSGPIVISPSIDTETVVNTIKITKITFDSVTNAIKIYWTKDSTQSKNYSIGISCSATGYPADTGVAKQIVTGNRSSDSVTISLGKSILFDTTYFVALWLKRGGGPWTSPIKTTVATHSYSWQEIVYFSLDSLRDTSYAFNKHVRLCNDIPSDPVTDSLAVWSPEDSLKNGFIPVSMGFNFKQKTNSPKFYVGIACDSIPQGNSRNVRLYRYDGHNWLVERSSVFDAAANIVYVKTNDLRFPFIAMVDTKKPAVSPVGKDDGPILSGTAIKDTVVVGDNISNMECTFRCAKGANAFSEGDSVDTILTSKSDTLIFTIPANYVNEDNGVRAFFVASDGANADTVNFSRQVIRSQGSDVVTADAMQWTPLHVTAMPDSPAASYALRNFAKNGAWHYDPAAFRMFRWLPCSLNVNTTDKWIEYSDAQKDCFSFVPGNVFWLKSRQRSVIDFGRATTLSLVEPFEILLQPDDWTDIAVPYKFNVVIGDVLGATIAAGQQIDSLEFYQWALNANKRYFPKPVYNERLSVVDSSLGNPAYALVSGENVGYTVLNTSHSAVPLSVVPVPVSMSRLSAALAKKLVRENWAIKAIGMTGDGASLGPVYCGYAGGKEKKADFFSAPPQLDNIALRVCDAAKRLFGHEIVRGSLDEGGTSFDVAIVNSSTAASEVEYRFETVNALPAGMQAMLVDPKTGTCRSIEKPLSVSVGGGERVYRRLVVGDKDYLAKIKLETRFWRLDFFGASPNPFSRMVRIRYSLPAAGISRVKVSIIGVSGRTVFETQRMSDNGPGLQEILWDGMDGHNRHVAAGVYVLRMTAFGDKAAVAGTFERKMTYMP
jgi:PKD repeat protein